MKRLFGYTYGFSFYGKSPIIVFKVHYRTLINKIYLALGSSYIYTAAAKSGTRLHSLNLYYCGRSRYWAIMFLNRVFDPINCSVPLVQETFESLQNTVGLEGILQHTLCTFTTNGEHFKNR